MLLLQDVSATGRSSFSPGSSLLVDTCVWLAVSDDQDAWHKVMSDLFDKYLLTANGPCLFYTDYIQGEFLNLVARDWTPKTMSDTRSPKTVAQEWWDLWTVRGAEALRPIANSLPTTDGAQDIKRVLWQEIDLGETDALIVAHACYYNMALLTVDNSTIVNKLRAHSSWFATVGPPLTVYYRPSPMSAVKPSGLGLPRPAAGAKKGT